MNPSNAPLWAFPQSIHFQSKAPLDAIVNALRQLNEGSTEAERYDMAVDPSEGGYRFRYTIERYSKRSTYSWYTTAVGEGQIWQDATGLVTVDGMARIDASLYGTVAFMFIVCIGADLLLASSLSLFFVLFLIMSAVMVYNYYRDCDGIVARISEAVGDASNAEKAKRIAIDERVSAIDHTAKPDSVWNEAISEYDSQQEQ